jgi:hypothetical protein
MSLPASQQRVLDRIEEALKRREPRLASMFAIFNRLNIHERLPWIEALKPMPWWSWKRYHPSARIRAFVLLTLAAGMVVSAVFVGMSQSRGNCNTPIMLRGPLIGAVQTHEVRRCPAAPVAKGYGHGP